MGLELPWSTLREQIKRRDAAVRRAVWGLLNVGGGSSVRASEAVALVRVALDDEDASVRVGAVRYLYNVRGEPEVAALLRKALKDSDKWVRGEGIAVLAAGGVEGSELVPELVRLIGENPRGTAEALGHFGQVAEPAVPRIREMLEDPAGREAAAVALWRITGDCQPLFAVVKDSISRGRIDGVDVLGDVGEAARPMVPEIAGLIDHESRWVRITAVTALGRIGGAEAENALRQRLRVENDQGVVARIREAIERLSD